MMKRFAIFLLVFCGAAALAFDACAGEDFDYTGSLKNEVWVQSGKDGGLSLSSFKHTLDLKFEYAISDGWAFFLHPRYFYDAAYDIRKSDPFLQGRSEMSTPYRTEWLRDCYLDYISDIVDVRIGKQQVSWGQADGVPILDRVMPANLKYYTLPDAADMRIPLWMLKVEYSPLLDSTLQFLFIPHHEYSHVAPAYAPFSFRALNDFEDLKRNPPIPGMQFFVDKDYPAQNFKNSRIGLRWRSMLGSIDYTLNWLYGYSTTAYTYLDRVDNFIELPPGSGNWIPLEYYSGLRPKLMQIMGFSFSRSFVEPGPLQGYTLRGEFGYTRNEPTYYGTEGFRVLTEKSDRFAYVLGLDKVFFTDWQFSGQFIQLIYNNHTQDGFRVLDNSTYGYLDKINNMLTFKVATTFMHDRLKPEMLVICSDKKDGRISLKAGYELREDLRANLGYHHFWGGARTPNGQFKNNDHWVLSLTYSF